MFSAGEAAVRYRFSLKNSVREKETVTTVDELDKMDTCIPAFKC